MRTCVSCPIRRRLRSSPGSRPTVRSICDAVGTAGEPLRAMPRYVFRQAARSLPQGRLRAAVRLRARVLPPGRRDEGPPVRRPPTSSTPSGTPGFPSSRQLIGDAERLRDGRHHRATASTRALNTAPRSRRHPGLLGARQGLCVRERGEGARPPERLLPRPSWRSRSPGSSGSAPTRTSACSTPGGANAFGDESDPGGGSRRACRKLSSPGSSRHARSVYALMAPTVNCLKRRRTHTFSPTNVSGARKIVRRSCRVKGGSIALAPRRAPCADLDGEPLPRRRGHPRHRGCSGSRRNSRSRPQPTPPAEEDPLAHAAPDEPVERRWTSSRRTGRCGELLGEDFPRPCSR